MDRTAESLRRIREARAKRSGASSTVGNPPPVTDADVRAMFAARTDSKVVPPEAASGIDLSHIHEELRRFAQPIGALTPDPDNARLHPDRNVDAIKESLQRFGQRLPLVVRIVPDGGNVVERGNGTLQAAKALGWSHVAAIFVEDDDQTAAGYSLADNRTGELAEWDYEKLSALFLEYEDDLGGLDVGWEEEELASLLDGSWGDDPRSEDDPGPQINRADELQKAWGTERGQIWEIPSTAVRTKSHRLLCGDATDEESMRALMGELLFQLLLTDPPYGVAYAAKNEFLNAIAPGKRIQTPMSGDHMRPEDTSQFWLSAFSAVRSFAAPGASYYVTGPQGGDLLLLLLLALRDSGFPLRHMLIWTKNAHVLGRSDYNYKHEPILYGWVEGAAHTFNGETSETSVWEHARSHRSDLHPTTKPVGLFARAIRNGTNRNELVVDPFLGSGTTMIAAEQLGRVCYGTEISPAYCAVALQRMQDMGLWPRLQKNRRIE